MKYTKIPIDTFKKLQMNVGVLLDSFTPSDGEVNDSSIIGATTDGISFSAKAEYTDFGEDIDNCPNNTKELKRKRYTTAVCSGTFVTVDSGAAKRLVGGADADSSDPAKVTPRNDLVDDDFEDLWLVGDYSDVNEDGSKKAGFIAIHMMNTLSTGGFSIQTTKDGKGRFAFEFTAHYSINELDKVPFEIYIKMGSAGGE